MPEYALAIGVARSTVKYGPDAKQERYSINVFAKAPFTQGRDLRATFERLYSKYGQDAQWSLKPRGSCFCVTAPATFVPPLKDPSV